MFGPMVPTRLYLDSWGATACAPLSGWRLYGFLLRYLDDMCYVRGAGFQKALNTFSGLMHLAPELKDKLPRSSRALVAWQRLDNPAEGGPVPETALGLIIETMARRCRWIEITVVLLSYDAFLRLASLSSSGLAPEGTPRIPGPTGKWSSRTG